MTDPQPQGGTHTMTTTDETVTATFSHNDARLTGDALLESLRYSTEVLHDHVADACNGSAVATMDAKHWIELVHHTARLLDEIGWPALDDDGGDR